MRMSVGPNYPEKGDEPELADLRPLCLLEALRKLWTRVFVTRMAVSNGMEPGQHCDRVKGTNSGFGTQEAEADRHKTTTQTT